ncbi:MAG: MATE family efflux transporter [Gammaproteobacteria bacterium]|nr:MATE family efflux transporter [Gammaproteobacteria bacterium]
MSESPQRASTRWWYRRVWAIAWPIILSNATVPLVGIVDTAVVGHLPDPAYIGAVAIGAIIFSFLYWGFNFLRMGTTGLVAQDLGGGDSDELRATMVRALVLALVLGLLIVLARAPIGDLAFLVLEGGEQVEHHARAYYDIRVLSAPAALANFALLGYFIGVQRTRIALALQLTLNGVNLVLDVLFVVVLGLGVEGVAGASLVGEYTAALLGLAMMRRSLAHAGGSWQLQRVLQASRLRALARINLDIFLRTLAAVFAFFYFTATGARLGEVPLAANAVLMHFLMFTSYSLDGFAHAAEALAGNAFGARDARAFRAAVRACTLLAIGVACGYALAFALLGNTVVALITGIAAVRETAAVYLPWVVALPLVAVWSFQLDGIFVGTTRSREMRNGMAIALAAYLAAVWLLVPIWGNHGLWAAMTLFMAARGLVMGMWYPRILRALE